jgi:hypothetical protein
MSSQRRHEDKKRRRLKRKEKRQAHMPGGDVGSSLLASIKEKFFGPDTPPLPGGCDPCLARPDFVKAQLGQFATERAPGRDKLRQFEQRLKQGLIGHVPNLHDWAMEAFLWHGVPGDAWHPID